MYTINKIDVNTGAVLVAKRFTNSVDAVFYFTAVTSLNEDAAVRYEWAD